MTNIWKPQVFQGKNSSGPYFEGWFFKLVNKSKDETFAIIPGIFKDVNNKESHSFIQFLDGKNHSSYYIKYNLKEFEFSEKKFEIFIGENSFSEDKISLKIMNEDISLSGDLILKNLLKWPVKIFSPGIMDWYAFVPFMECYHGIVSMSHELEGNFFYNSKKINFDKGRGYTEKDWGTSFPSAYVWMQSNHFSNESVSFMLSVAKIPWLRGSFVGFLCGIYIENKLYKFATYTGAKIKSLTVEEDKIDLELFDKNFNLKILASRIKGGILFGPYNNSMINKVSESISSKINIKLYDSKSKGIIFEGEGTNAGIDVNGDVKELSF